MISQTNVYVERNNIIIFVMKYIGSVAGIGARVKELVFVQSLSVACLSRENTRAEFICAELFCVGRGSLLKYEMCM